jgi:hypothetical protein
MTFYKYINGNSLVDIAYELNIHHTTVSNLVNFYLEIIAEEVASRSVVLGGRNLDGSSKVV